MRKAIIALMLVYSCANAQLTPEQAFELGKSVHPDAAANLSYGGVLNSDRASSLQPYDANSPEHSQYWTGNQSLTSPVLQGGANLNVQCLDNNDPANDQQRCEAVRYINQTAEMRAQMDAMIPPGDPLRLIGKTIADDPEAIAGAFGGAYSNCVEQTLTYDGDFAYETCQDSLENGPAYCAIGRNVVVDAHHLYSCARTLKQLYSGQCTVGRVIQVEKHKNYQCKVKPEVKKTYTCDRTLIIQCTQGGSWCAPNGVQFQSAFSSNASFSVSFDINSGTFSFTTNLKSSRNVNDAKFYFNVVGKDRLTQFHLAHITSDNFTGFSLNGHWILMQNLGKDSRGILYGPETGGVNCSIPATHTCSTTMQIIPDSSSTLGALYGRDTNYFIYAGQCTTVETNCRTEHRIENGKLVPRIVCDSAISCASASQAHYRDGSGAAQNYDLDLRRFLVEGINELHMFVANGDVGGGGTITINAHQQCDPVCTDAWNDGCASFR
jgi:hypothetical protein